MIRARRLFIALCMATCLSLGGASLATAGSASDAAQAAARTAQAQHGGRILKVERREGGYRVKLLKDSGKVKVVFVPLPEKGNSSDTKGADAKRKGRESSRGPQREGR